MRVLVADHDAARAKRLCEACIGRSHVVERAAHGAAALELCLERIPDAIVCPVDLAVIDGIRLSEILRSNPRTRSSSFIFLVQDEMDAPLSMDARDATIVQPWHDRDVLAVLDAILERGSRFGDLRSGTEIEGKLSQISAVDLLQIFQMNRKSGTVRITREAGHSSASINVRDGQVSDACIPLRDGTSLQGEKALFRMLRWTEGRFEFLPGEVADASRITRSTRELLLEGMRQKDEAERVCGELPPAGVPLEPVEEKRPDDPGALAVEVLDAVEAYRLRDEILDHTAAHDAAVLHALLELVEAGAVRPVAGPDSAGREGGSEAALLTPSEMRRLREWAASQRPRPGSALKVVVASASPPALLQFVELLRRLSGFVADGRLVREPERSQRLAVLGHLPLEEGASLRLIGVPADPAYGPLWDVAGHGMLGAIVLPGGPTGPDLEATEAACARLRGLRSGTVVHALLGTGAPPPQFRQREAAESGGWFELPADDPRVCLDALRRAFSRLVP